jgi:predicted Zn-dependent protease
MRRNVIAAAAILAAVLATLASAPTAGQPAAEAEGVEVRRPSLLRNFVPAAKLEATALRQFSELKDHAARHNALLASTDPASQRVERIIKDLLPHTHKWHPRAKDWRWQVVVIKTSTVNALCMPGGKIAVFTGILDRLKLSDDETAVVLGHEMAHALREHARARAAKVTITRIGTLAVALLIGGNAGELARAGGGLLALKFSRDDERDADLIGMERAARAGYNPAAAITLWEKMGSIARSAPPAWLSTHPSGQERIARLKANLTRVMPIYERQARRAPSTSPQ